jgi:hypothetical protein
MMMMMTMIMMMTTLTPDPADPAAGPAERGAARPVCPPLEGGGAEDL